jgi:hypothetical protein
VKAFVAIAHKIIKVMWHVITKKEPYRDNTVDLEALLVKRRAPRWLKQMAKHDMLDRAILAAKAKPPAKAKPASKSKTTANHKPAKPAKAKPPINSKRTGEVMMAV